MILFFYIMSSGTLFFANRASLSEEKPITIQECFWYLITIRFCTINIVNFAKIFLHECLEVQHTNQLLHQQEFSPHAGGCFYLQLEQFISFFLLVISPPTMFQDTPVYQRFLTMLTRLAWSRLDLLGKCCRSQFILFTSHWSRD